MSFGGCAKESTLLLIVCDKRVILAKKNPNAKAAPEHGSPWDVVLI